MKITERIATGGEPKDVGPKARLSPPAIGALPQARGCPTARVSTESQRAFRLLAGAVSSATLRSSLAPVCEQVSAAKLLGRAEKFATAQRDKHRPASPKKLMVGPWFSGRCLSSAGGQTAAWPLRTGVVFYFHRLPKKFITSWRFCHGVSFTTQFVTHFLTSAGSAPMQRANICAQRDGLIARGGSSATRKRALRPSAEVGPSTRPPLAQVVSRGLQFR